MKFNKNKLPSRHVSVGPERAPHRSYYYAMGMDENDINKPFVGVVSTWNEAAPCNIALMRQAQSVKKGVTEAEGTPREFCTITVTDGIAMGHQGMKSSLVSREVIADSTELTVRGHCYDAIVGLAGCDKSLPEVIYHSQLIRQSHHNNDLLQSAQLSLLLLHVKPMMTSCLDDPWQCHLLQ